MLHDMIIGSVAHGYGGVIKARLRTGFFIGAFCPFPGHGVSDCDGQADFPSDVPG